MKKSLHLRLKKSISGRKPDHVACVKGLGLTKLNQRVEVEKTSSTLGMVRKVSYLLDVLE